MNHPPAGSTARARDGQGHTGAPAIVAEALHRTFGATRAVDGLSLAVAPGELYGLVGPDGAGKTTTLRMLAGLVAPTGGAAFVLGRPVVAGDRGARVSIGYMPQQYSLYGDLSVDENLAFFGRLFGLDRRALAERRAELLAIARLDRFGDRRADDLSGGMYKKLALSCALLHRPRVLVLDEPSNGVDPVSRREIWELLYRFVGEGMAVILATPYMDEAARCHRVGLLSHGRLVAEGAPRDLADRSPHAVLRLDTPDRDAAEARLRDRPDVLACSPQGAHLRVVARRAAVPALLRELQAAGVAAHAVRPDFEDVYLGLLAEAEGHS